MKRILLIFALLFLISVTPLYAGGSIFLGSVPSPAGSVGEATTVAISGGVVSLTKGGVYKLENEEGSETSDDLDSIDGLSEGDIVYLSPASDSETVIVKHGTYIKLENNTDFTMDSQYDQIVLRCMGGNVCVELSRSGNDAAVNSGDHGLVGRTTSVSGTVNVTTGYNYETFVTSDTATFNLPTGDLSAFVGLLKRYVKGAAGTVTIDPGAGNFCAGGGAGKTLVDSTAGETYACITLILASSSGSVNKWIIPEHGTWVSTP